MEGYASEQKTFKSSHLWFVCYKKIFSSNISHLKLTNILSDNENNHVLLIKSVKVKNTLCNHMTSFQVTT